MFNVSKNNPERLILVVVSFLVAFLNFITLAFNIINFDAMIFGTDLHNEVNGYSVLKEYPSAIEEIGGWLVTYSIIHLLLAVAIAIALVYTFVKYDECDGNFMKAATIANVLSVIASFIYLINGGATVSAAKESVGTYAEIETFAFVPFIIITIFVTLFFLIKMGVLKNLIKPKENNNKTDRFDEVEKYKQLLDRGIISEEEFEAKKKEILGF